MSSCLRTTTPFPQSNKTTAATGDKSMSAGQFLPEKKSCVRWGVSGGVCECKDKGLVYSSIPQTTAQPTVFLPKFFFFFFSPLTSSRQVLFFKFGRGSNQKRFSERDGMCEGICRSERGSAGAGRLREQHRQISGGRIICASWEAARGVGQRRRQMEGLAV